jgi:16S rRNA (adenine1518-N6/adenine1519-N6)-dimethyltransferase
VVYAKRSLSQNFLVDPNIRRKLVAELDAGAQDLVLEIGAGHGELSDLIAGTVRCLVLVEKDDRLAAELADRFDHRADVEVVHADALDTDLAALVGDSGGQLISNVPYGITSPLIFHFLEMHPIPGLGCDRPRATVSSAGPGDPGGPPCAYPGGVLPAPQAALSDSPLGSRV